MKFIKIFEKGQGKLVEDTILNSAQFKCCEVNLIIDSIPVVVVPNELSL